MNKTMGNHYGLFISIAAVCGLVQSAVWLSLEILGCLVYLCAVPVEPYAGSSDFFRVTFVKLYFEGPRCIPDGSYLGKFNKEYRDPEKINLLTPDIVFTIMVAKIIFDVAYIVLCILLYKTNKSGNDGKLRDLVISWSTITFIMSALDAFLSAKFLLDIFSLTRYLDGRHLLAEETNLRGIQFIPLILGMISARLVVFWFWNVCVAACFLTTGLCCKKKLLKETEDVGLEQSASQPAPVQTFSSELRKRYSDNRHQFYDPKSQSDWDLYSMEAITRFDEGPERSLESYVKRTLTLPPAEKRYGDRYGERSGSEPDGRTHDEDRQHWEETNVGYVRDEGDSDLSSSNMESGKIDDKSEGDSPKSFKLVKRPVGKPVSVPVPPPLPKSDSFSC